jgi:hypothetical protein
MVLSYNTYILYFYLSQQMECCFIREHDFIQDIDAII